MVLTFIVIYIVVTLLIGAMTARKVKSASDFVLAGRKLPLMLASTALFATWFGSETVLGASSEFVAHGLLGVIEDPFGASLCLLLIGLFVARPLYRLKILTLCDYYRQRFGKRVELLASLCMIPSYFGWIAAQMVAMGLIFQAIAGINMVVGICVGAAVVLIYTYIGGMWAISITDFLQSMMIIGGLLYLMVDLLDAAGGIRNVLAQTPEGFFDFLPKPEPVSMLEYLAAWITIGLGSIPQQDVFQRIMAAKNVKVAVRASYIGASMYLTIGFVPLVIGLCAGQVYPEILNSADDAQLFIPQVVLAHMSLPVQALFFGALLSAIMSTTSGAILAPASILAENIIRPRIKDQGDKKALQLLRLSVVIVTVCAAIMANLQSNIYDLVAQSSALSLVSLFVPLIAGLYWSRATKSGALLSIVLGMAIWLIAERLETAVPPILLGLSASLLGMLVGSVLRLQLAGE